MSEDAPTVRLDVWLWRARFFKTRSLSSAAVTKRGVRITRHGQTRRTDKPSALASPGDVLTFTRARRIEVVEVVAVGERRGPAREAAELYKRLGEADD
ncbi:MAG: RNA-binding S4 domain-containing protein [Pseudomonadota bacterium]